MEWFERIQHLSYVCFVPEQIDQNDIWTKVQGTDNFRMKYLVWVFGCTVENHDIFLLENGFEVFLRLEVAWNTDQPMRKKLFINWLIK